jgi:acetyl esterase/lipase
MKNQLNLGRGRGAWALATMMAVCFSCPSARAADEAGDGLTRKQAETAVREGMEKLRGKPVRDGLDKNLPDSVEKMIEAAKKNGGRIEIKARELPLGDKAMPYAVIRREKGEPAKGGRALFICMHGGGQYAKAKGPHAWPMNTQEFQTQTKMAIALYEPDGVYFIPRMADDRLGRWWHKHNQVAFDAVIDNAIVHWGVSPDRVYLLGVSEGGYGTDILAVWMPDRFAGADAMAAGVGLGTPPANLRNIAFRTDIGANDMMFDRRPMAVAFHAELDRLHKLDPGGYVHTIHLQEGRGHGIDYKPGVTWIAKHTRNPWPERVVWINQPLDGRRRDRFYWLAMPDAPKKGNLRLTAEADREKNTVVLEVSTLDARNTDRNRTHGKDNVAESPRKPLAGARVELLLSDRLLDLDKPVTVVCNGRKVFEGKVERSRKVIEAALARRPDPAACPTAKLTIGT